MSIIHKITLPDGRQVRALEADFEVVKEEWNIYTLANGMRLRAISNVAKILLLVDDQGNLLPDEHGDPQAMINGDTRFILTDQQGHDIPVARHPDSGEWVTIDPDQAWFWSREWLEGELAVDRELRSGEYEEFDNFDDLIDSL